MGGICSTVAGAVVLEKHFTLSRTDGGVDSSFSLDIDELGELCKTVKQAHSALGNAESEVTASEAGTRQFRRSLYFVKDISAGETITADAVRSIRPSNGLHPKYLKEIIGMIASKDISYGTPTTWEVIKKQK
jgi:N-acetylneuraminate synthase